MRIVALQVFAIFFLVGCSSSGGAGGSGGQPGSGGSATGGATGAGGSAAGGGSGGAVGAGGTHASSGGTGGSGATEASGGTAAAGSPTGGTSGRGGASGSGGAGSGGTAGGPGAGGATTPGAGGTAAKGGADGGMPDARGSGGGGGTTAGSTGGGGGGGVAGGPNLPAAGASGQAAPTGAGSKVTVLDWAGFKSAVSFTFDDSNSSQISNYSALQALNDKGNNVRYTFYLWTGKQESSNQIWATARKDGHELGNHTKSHVSNATTTDIQAAEDFLKSTFGVTSYDVAAPNGDSSYVTVVPSMNEFLTNRTAGNGGGISPTTDPSKQWQLPCIIPATGAAASAMESSISSTISGGKWVTFLVHGFTGGTDGAYQPVSISEFTATVSWAKTQGNIWLDTVENVASYWIAEYKFNKLTPTTSGSDKTWTWKTSDFATSFPPGKVLRVTTDGGTLKQGNTTLAWNDHGYYEISLDAGTLTLSP